MAEQCLFLPKLQATKSKNEMGSPPHEKAGSRKSMHRLPRELRIQGYINLNFCTSEGLNRVFENSTATPGFKVFNACAMPVETKNNSPASIFVSSRCPDFTSCTASKIWPLMT